jgi:hypothetical protein
MDDALDLYVLADQYQENELSLHCLEVIRRGLTNENALLMLVEVDGLGLDPLKDVCMSYVVSNFKKVAMNEECLDSLSHALTKDLLVGLAASEKYYGWVISFVNTVELRPVYSSYCIFDILLFTWIFCWLCNIVFLFSLGGNR